MHPLRRAAAHALSGAPAQGTRRQRLVAARAARGAHAANPNPSPSPSPSPNRNPNRNPNPNLTLTLTLGEAMGMRALFQLLAARYGPTTTP